MIIFHPSTDEYIIMTHPLINMSPPKQKNQPTEFFPHHKLDPVVVEAASRKLGCFVGQARHVPGKFASRFVMKSWKFMETMQTQIWKQKQVESLTFGTSKIGF